MKRIAEGIVALNPASENPLEEERSVFREIVAGTAYQLKKKDEGRITAGILTNADRRRVAGGEQIGAEADGAGRIGLYVTNDEVLETLREKFKSASSHFKKFWQFSDRAFRKWRATNNSGAPNLLTQLIREAPFLRGLPLPLHADIVVWIPKSEELKCNPLFEFTQRIYPPPTPRGIRPRSKLLSQNDFDNFDASRRAITWMLWEIGETLITKKLEITGMSELFQNITLIKFSSYLEVALVAHLDTMGPNKIGLYALWKKIAEMRGEVSPSTDD